MLLGECGVGEGIGESDIGRAEEKTEVEVLTPGPDPEPDPDNEFEADIRVACVGLKNAFVYSSCTLIAVAAATAAELGSYSTAPSRPRYLVEEADEEVPWVWGRLWT